MIHAAGEEWQSVDEKEKQSTLTSCLDLHNFYNENCMSSTWKQESSNKTALQKQHWSLKEIFWHYFQAHHVHGPGHKWMRFWQDENERILFRWQTNTRSKNTSGHVCSGFFARNCHVKVPRIASWRSYVKNCYWRYSRCCQFGWKSIWDHKKNGLTAKLAFHLANNPSCIYYSTDEGCLRHMRDATLQV